MIAPIKVQECEGEGSSWRKTMAQETGKVQSKDVKEGIGRNDPETSPGRDGTRFHVLQDQIREIPTAGARFVRPKEL
jgi:hypothetical protein